jgi:biopolymer transport protein ExbD
MKQLLLSVFGLLLAQVCLAAQPQSVALVIAADGKYLLQGKPVADSELKERLLDLRNKYKSVDFHVVGAPEVSYERAAFAVKAAQEAGLLHKQALLTPPSPQSAPASRATQ